MTKVITILTIALFSLGIQAQETKPAKKETVKKESCCSKKSDSSKKMTDAEIQKCKAKCKAEGKTCDAGKTKKDKKSCCAKA